MNKKLEFWLSLLFVLAVVTMVYYPTLSHMLRGESYLYFVETKEDTTALALIKNWWNYESVRTIAPGDTMMFRPLLFVALALEKAYFGLNYFWWRLASMLMHLTAVTCLFRLLWKIKLGILATLMTIIFGASYLALSTMLYEQIACYSLFTALLLTGLYYTYQGTENNSKKDLALASVCMLVSCFFHETGVVFTGLFFIYFWWERKRLGSSYKYWGLSFFTIMLIWTTAYFLAKFLYPPKFLAQESYRLFDLRLIPASLYGLWALTDRWITQSVIPAIFVVEPLRELCFHSFTIYRKVSLNIPFLLNCLAIVAMGITYLCTEIQEKARNSFIALIVSAMIFFMIANSAFRTFTHGAAYLIDHNFNMYIWLALATVLVYILIGKHHLDRKFTWLVVGALVIFIGLNAPISLSLNLDTSKSQEPTKEYFATIDEFIEEHKGEQDLSFDILTTLPMQENLEFFYWKVPEGKDNRPTKEELLTDYYTFYSSVPEVKYAEYWNNNSPKYILEYNPESNKLIIK